MKEHECCAMYQCGISHPTLNPDEKTFSYFGCPKHELDMHEHVRKRPSKRL